jgi:hypothetical protein
MARKNSVIQPLGLSVLVALGFCLAIAFVIGIGIKLVEETLRSHKFLYEEKNLVFRPDGEALVRDLKSEEIYSSVKYFTLDGREVNVKGGEQGIFLSGILLRGPEARETRELPLKDFQRVGLFFNGRRPPNPWYFIHNGRPEGRAYFAGYEVRSKSCLGYIGRRGFQAKRPAPDEQLPIAGADFLYTVRGGMISYYWRALSWPGETPTNVFAPWRLILIAENRLLGVDLREGAVRPFGEVKDPLSLAMQYSPGRFQEMLSSGMTYGLGDELVVRTADRLWLLNPAGKALRSYVIPEIARQGDFDFYELPGQKAVIAYHQYEGEISHGEYLWIDPAGKFLNKISPEWDVRFPPNHRPDTRTAALATLAPLPWTIIASQIYNESDHGPSPRFLGDAVQENWLTFVILLAFSLALAVYCYRRQRRYSQPGAAAWAAFVFLFGVPGLLAYLFHRRWPLLETCPACGKAVPRDRLTCAACNVVFPKPPLKGIEVLT